MTVSCECAYGGDYEWFFSSPTDFTRQPIGRRHRCYSCRTVIPLYDDCGEFACERPATEWEEIHLGWDGEQVEIASIWMCASCTGLFWALEELGYCVELEKGERMRDLAKLTTDPERWHGEKNDR